MQALPGFHAISRNEPRRSRVALIALGALLALVALAIAARPAAAAPASRSCPSFKVLHNDRIGAAVFPAGNYTINLESTALDCTTGASLFARFLEDFDGNLPSPWRVTAEGTGRASFPRGSQPGFSVELTQRQSSGEIEREGARNPDLGTLCRNPFTVNHTTTLQPLRFTRGKFLIYLPPGSRINCEQAVRLFQRFLGNSPFVPAPWKLDNQTATFYRVGNPRRSAFRIEPLNGVGRR